MTGRTMTEAQRAVLALLNAGQSIAHSQDGEVAWLYPDGRALAEQDIIALREIGFIESAPYDEDEHARFGPPDVISAAGRAALAREADHG